MPIVEPEIPIEHEEKQMIEQLLARELEDRLDKFDGKCILKLTLPDMPNLFLKLTQHPKVSKVVGLSGGYSTVEACNRLALQENMTASFSRALSEGLFVSQSEEEFNNRISENIKAITIASN